MKREEILKNLYEKIMEDNNPPKEVREVERKLLQERELFLKQVGQQYRKDLEHITDIVIEMCHQQEQEAFYQGFLSVIELIINPKNKEVS